MIIGINDVTWKDSDESMTFDILRLYLLSLKDSGEMVLAKHAIKQFVIVIPDDRKNRIKKIGAPVRGAMENFLPVRDTEKFGKHCSRSLDILNKNNILLFLIKNS